MEWIDHLQWPAMAVTIVGAWFIGSRVRWQRRVGFWSMLGSNLLWMAWGWHVGAWALVGLQVFLALINIRSARNNDEKAPAAD